MRWNCPHCATGLAISGEKLVDGWNFSRCYRCAGFALVRKSQVNLVKLDKAPVNERVLLSEAPSQVSASADPLVTKNLEALRRPEQLARLAPPPFIRPAPTVAPAQKVKPSAPTAIFHAPPEVSQAIVTAQNAAEAIKEQTPPQVEARLPEPKFPPSPIPAYTSHKTPKFSPSHFAFGIAAAIAISSGVSLYRQGRDLLSTAEQARLSVERDNARRAALEATHASTSQEPAPYRLADSRSQVISDSVQSAAMAPTRTGNLLVQVAVSHAILRAGPGVETLAIGRAQPAARYVVAEWKDRWFKIILPETSPKGPQTAWIRNDLVHLVSK